MNGNHQTVNDSSSRDIHDPSPPHSYNFLLELSRRLGKVATKSFVEVRHFLHQEITVSPTERFLSGMPKLHLPRSNNRDPHESPVSLHYQDSSMSSSNTSPSMAPSAKGQQEGSKAASAEKEKAIQQGDVEIDANDLQSVIRQSQEVLASANTVFPITLFPDTVFVDRTKVTIIRRDFFWSSDTMSIRIEDVLNVSATVGPLFGSLTVASRVMSTIDHFQINHFWRTDAIHLKHIIQGYVIAQHNKIDTAHLSKEDLIKTLVEIGHDTN